MSKIFECWRRHARRCVVAAAAFVVSLVSSGCLTDGSIPVGGNGSTGSARGVVVLAENPDVPVVGARVSVREPGGLPYRTVTDGQGRFVFENLPKGRLEATFEGPQPGDYLPVRVFVETNWGSFSTIAVALAPAHLGVDDVASVRVLPSSARVAVGQSVVFEAAISGGVSVRKVPTWVVEGGIGSIDARGRFQALRPGTGTVRAIAGSAQDAVQVTVFDR